MSRARAWLLIDAARAHGEQSEPDHEIGDLQEILLSCWEVMTPEQRSRVYKEHADKVEDWVPEDSDPDERIAAARELLLNLDAIADAVIAKRKRRL